MAERQKTEKERALIDPVYEKFVRGVLRSIGSTEFYGFFMDSISRAQNEFQFSNRKLVKTVDLTWVDAIEETLEAMQNIIASPRNVIREEELIVNVANVKKSGAETVRHLAQHSNLVEDFDAGRGEVRPNRMMQRYREDTVNLYENRLVFTTMEMAHHFVKIRHDALFEAMSDEFGAKLKLKSDMNSATEHVHMDMFLHIKQIDSALDTDEKNSEVFGRISRIYRVLNVFMSSPFAQELSKQNRIKGSVTKTNVLKKNPSYKAVLKLFEFLRNYTDIGYTIRVVEQNPQINEQFQQDIYHNILFNYLILKGYLQDEEDRTLPTKAKGRSRTLKPKFIHEIVEELTEDYDLPDVEIRKVLIEELTKAQLMQEEAAERRRLVEEREARKKAEEERLRAERKAEQERLKAERAAERERKRQERLAEEERKRQERMERELEDRRRSKLFRGELDHFRAALEEQMEKRKEEEEAARRQTELEDYADAVRLLEEEEERRAQEKARERQRKLEEKERQKREQELAEEQAQEEELRQQQEREQAQAQQRAEDLNRLLPYTNELAFFRDCLPQRMEQRVRQAEVLRREEEQRQQRKRGTG